ncbi:hypothetical protein DSLASN_00310 [Desulfoluna limicola]|uniref:Uncharacterized protein n=1 Tax=Desulfoluna limicola TaxID=2810562 RepID=A0ABM7PB54_9BACT|nr:hypothetical protein DSLASN_00310 [Desulfoluna limicola]
MPPAALRGGQTVETLYKQPLMDEPDKFMVEGGYSLPWGTRGKTYPLPAFKVAYLAAGDDTDSFQQRRYDR